jgi:hypothetical protein
MLPTPDRPTRALDTRLRLLLCGILLAAYMVVYTGLPDSIDSSATLAAAVSFLKHATPDITIIGSSEALLPPLARMGSFGVDGLLYAKKGITPSLAVLPLATLAQAVPFLPLRATAMLLNPIVTTLTALLIYTFARWLDYRPGTAFVTALVYGLATFALVYSATLFGEPLAALLLLTALMAAHRYRQGKDSKRLLAAGFALGLLCGVNLTYLVMAPLLGLYAFGLDARRWQFSHLALMIAPFAVMIALLLAYNGARFGSLFESGYNFAEGEGFTVPFGEGLFGLLLSPYRGIIWYNPVLLLSIPGALLLYREKMHLPAIILVLVIAQLLAYASWWSWHGGIVWGPRFLIPVTPLLALLLLPVIERLPHHRLFTAAFGLLGLLSLLMQLLGSLFSINPHISFLYQNFPPDVIDGFFVHYNPAVVYRLDASPIIGQFRTAFSGQQLQPALFQNADALHGILVLVMLAVGILAYHYTKERWHIFAAAGIMFAAMIGIAARQQEQMALSHAVMQELIPADLLIAASSDYDDNLLDVRNPVRIITTNAPTPPDDPLAGGLWEYVMRQQGLAWFITWFPPVSAENWQEYDLWQRASFVRETTFHDNRALLFDLNPSAQPDQPGGWTFGPVRLAQYGIRHDPDGVRVALQWTPAQPTPLNMAWFVHLLDSSGQIIQQQDRAPQGGYAPTSTWESDSDVTDYLFFPLTDPVPATGWQLRLGWVNPDSGERLPVTNSDGEPVMDGFVLLPVN